MTQDTGWSDADLARLRLEGLEHLNRLQSGTATEREEAEFLAWRGQSRAHEEAFRAAVRLQRMVRAAESEPRASSAQEASTPEASTWEDAPAAMPVITDDTVVAFPGSRPPAAPRRAVSRRAILTGAVAASAAGLVFIGRSLEFIPSVGEMAADYRTGPGERRLVQLAGGATVDLNTRTSISLVSDRPLPTIELIAGEAILTTGTAAEGRLALLADGGESIGRNARFSARRDDAGVCVTCLEGGVEVELGGERRVLAPQQQIRYRDGRFGDVVGADPRLVTAWQSGTLIFQNMPMRDVVAEINRYRPGRVILNNSSLASRPLTGTYYVHRLDEFFSQAELAFGLNVQRLPGDIVILS